VTSRLALSMLALLVVACGGTADADPSADGPDAMPADEVADDGSEVEADAVSSGGTVEDDTDTGGATVEDGEITLSMTEFAYDPGPLTVAAGRVVIHAVNDGQVVHEIALSVSGEGHAHHLSESGDVDPGDRVTLELDLEPGEYELACHVTGHYEAGMVTTLTVTP
jgi:plastocyanin